MPSGGARARSGPAPDPNALRRDRKDDGQWVVLPAEGFAGEIPVFPLERVPVFDVYYVDKQRVKELSVEATEARADRELRLWDVLWRKPQAVMWDRLGMQFQVAAYVRAFVESTGADSNAGLKTAALRMEGEIGLSLPGMHSLRWRIAEDELSGRRTEVKSSGVSARDRLKALDA